MTRTRPPQSADTFRPPLISLIYCALWGIGAMWLYRLGAQSWEPATTFSLGAGAMAIGQLLKAMRDWERVRFHRRKYERFKKQKEQQNPARWATASDIDNSKFLSSSGGVFLGCYATAENPSKEVFYDGEGSISIIAPPGQGKTTSIVIPTLLANPQENLIINDPKGEAYAICKEALEKQNYQVLTLCPFANELSGRLNVPLYDAGLDIYSEFDAEMDPRSTRRRLMKINSWLCPDKPDMTDKDKFFIKGAKMLGSFFDLTDLRDGYKPCLPSKREQLMAGMHHLTETFVKAEESTAFSGLYAELARSLGGVLRSAPQQFAGSFSVLEQHIDVYDEHSELGQHVSGVGIDPKVLKDPEQKTAVFLISGLENIELMSTTTSLTLNYLFDSIAADMRQGRCTAIIDECGSLSGMTELPSKLERYRGANLRCVMIWQDAEGQAERNYGRVAVKQILAASQLKAGTGLQEQGVLSMFSTMCGKHLVEQMSLNDGTSFVHRAPHVTHSDRHVTIPLFPEHAIRTMSDEEILVIGGNLQPLRLRKLPYFSHPVWRETASASPFRGELSCGLG